MWVASPRSVHDFRAPELTPRRELPTATRARCARTLARTAGWRSTASGKAKSPRRKAPGSVAICASTRRSARRKRSRRVRGAAGAAVRAAQVARSCGGGAGALARTSGALSAACGGGGSLGLVRCAGSAQRCRRAPVDCHLHKSWRSYARSGRLRRRTNYAEPAHNCGRTPGAYSDIARHILVGTPLFRTLALRILTAWPTTPVFTPDTFARPAVAPARAKHSRAHHDTTPPDPSRVSLYPTLSSQVPHPRADNRAHDCLIPLRTCPFPRCPPYARS